jgi:hypothetical protein
VPTQAAELSIYDDEEFASIDVGSLMRRGHPDIIAGDDHIVREVRRICESPSSRQRHFLDVGSGSGDLVKVLTASIPNVVATAIEPAATPAAQAREKLRGNARANVFEGLLEDWRGKVDGVISWGSHHHLSHDYLCRVAELIGPSGTFIIGDEFSPEYLDNADIARLENAEILEVIDGFVFDSRDDIRAYRETGRVTPWALELEERRRRALWTWYKFVGDYAIDHGEWDVLLAELPIARNDLITAYSGEHKTSPLLLERELRLSGMEIATKFVVGERPAGLCSFVLYTCKLAKPGNNGKG